MLNLNGEMIGINVAVRIGAQGIAFAIPVNDAMEVAAELMGKLARQKLQHGLTVKTVYVDDQPQLYVDSVLPSSPASKTGIGKGDRILSVDARPISNRLDFECALVAANHSAPVMLDVEHGKSRMTVELNVAQVNHQISDIAWDSLGLKLIQATEAEMLDRHPMYKMGLRVVEVLPGSSADNEGILPGDILVAMAGFKTESPHNLQWVLAQPALNQKSAFKFYVLRDTEPFWGQMRVASRSYATGK